MDESDSESISSDQFLREEWSTDVEQHVLSSKFEDILVKFEHEASVTWTCEKLQTIKLFYDDLNENNPFTPLLNR